MHNFKNLNNNTMYIVPVTDTPVKVIIENNGCIICKGIEKKLKNKKIKKEIMVCKCNNCGRVFFV
jgi:hypothetical protein